jgi:lauroyl/myristoyl acyltransferase
MRDQLVAEAAACTTHNKHNIRTSKEGAKKMYTHFKKGKMVLRPSNNDNRASAIFFDCPACRTATLALIATVIQFNFEK